MKSLKKRIKYLNLLYYRDMDSRKPQTFFQFYFKDNYNLKS